MSKRLTINQLREIARNNPDDVRVIESIDRLKQAADEILARAKANETEFNRRIAEHLPWFDGSAQSWARLRGTLTLKLNKDLDWWMDQCNEPMIFGFVEAISERQDADEIIDTATAKKIVGTTSGATFARWMRDAGVVKVKHGKWRRSDIKKLADGYS